MTADDAQAAKWQGNCHAQNNLDYLHQLFNGWCQGKAAYGMGSWCKSSSCGFDISLLTNSQLGRMLDPTWRPTYDLMKRILHVYTIYSTRCSVARPGWRSALNAYRPILQSFPCCSLWPSLLKPIRHDTFGLVSVSLDIVIQSKHHSFWVNRTQCSSCVVWIVDHVELCLGAACCQ